jgi:hypothetical protein
MPRQLQGGLVQLLGRRDRNIESHSTLQLFVIRGAERRNYYLATASLTFDGIDWAPELRKASQIRAGLSRVPNQAILDLQNVDTNLGIEFLNLQEFVFGAEAKVGRYWRDVDSGAEGHDVFLTGVVTGLDISEEAVQLTVVSDPYSSVSVGASRTITRICQWQIRGDFKGPECGYVGPESVCNGLLNDSGGCEGRHGTPLKFAKFGGFPYVDNAVKFLTI